jgi:hypothetical protein
MGCRSGIALVALVLRGLSRAERNAASVRRRKADLNLGLLVTLRF